MLGGRLFDHRVVSQSDLTLDPVVNDSLRVATEVAIGAQPRLVGAFAG